MTPEYSAVVIDDHRVIREALVKTIDWAALGFATVEQAENGFEGQRIVAELRPELVVTDIRMDGMDGLALAAWIRTHLPQSRVVMITGYQDFAYAKKALELGVHNLVLKPLDNGQLTEIIAENMAAYRRAKDEEAARRRLREQNRAYERKLSGALGAQQAQFFKRVLRERPKPYDIPDGELEVLRLAGATCAVVLCRAYRLAHLAPDEALAQAAHQLALRAGAYGWQLYTGNSHGGLQLVMYTGAGENEAGFAASLRRLLLEANDALEAETGARLRFALGGVSGDVREVPALAAAARDVLEREFFTATRELLPEAAPGTPAPAAYPAGQVGRWLDALHARPAADAAQDIQREVDRLLDELAQSVGGSEAAIKHCMSEIVIGLLRQNPPAAPGAPGLGGMLAGLDAVNSLAEGKALLAGMARDILARTGTADAPQNPYAARALAYIQAHYREDLSLSALAEELALTPSYLSRLLKKETGKNFTDLLAEARIAEAKQLLTFSDLRVAEVGEQVGYTDYTYFYQIFKRFEQISPSEYKKQNKNTP